MQYLCVNGRGFRQQGFSLVEVAIVTAIILLIAILSVPAVGTYVIENKVPKVGEALQRLVIRMQINAQGSGDTPYAGIDNRTIAHALRDSPVFTTSGADKSTIAHGLSISGGNAQSQLSVAPVSVGSGGVGAGFALTLNNVNHAACPALASIMQGVSSIIRIEGGEGRVTVKDDTAKPTIQYSAIRAANACSAGDTNNYVFVAR